MKKQVVLQALLFKELIEEARPRPLEHVVFMARVKAEKQRKKLRSGEEKEYIIYRITIPGEEAKKLGLNPEEENLLLVKLARPRWYHLMNYSDQDVIEALWKKLPTWIKAELCSNKLAPEKLCSQYQTITLVMTQQEIKELGLDLNKPITLEELKKKILEKQ